MIDGARARWRRRAAFACFVVVVGVQGVTLIRGRDDPHHVFAFHMFNQSSSWRAEIVRVDHAGRRIPIDAPWPGGYRWSAMVRDFGLSTPGVRHHADAGVEGIIAFMDDALDWVATHTPNDRDTDHLEATMTIWKNERAPRTVVLRGRSRGIVT